MGEDFIVELSRLRHILRLATQCGNKSIEAEQALGKFLELSQRLGEKNLIFEYQRWSTHLACLP